MSSKFMNIILISCTLFISQYSFATSVETPTKETLSPNQEPPQSAQVSTIDLDQVITNATTKVVNSIKQTKGQVAVMDFPSLEGNTTGLSAYVSNRTANKLIAEGRQVVDRATLEKVISEQKLQQNALMDAGTAARIGKLAGAGVFIIGNYIHMSSKFVLTVRALSVETGQFIPGAVAEEIIRPVPSDMVAEINELIGKRAVASVTTLESTEESTASSPEQQPTQPTDFDIALCKAVSPNADLGQYIKLAYEHDVLPHYGEDKNLWSDWTCIDSLGEELESSTCQTIGNFVLTSFGHVWASDVAKGIKGKTVGRKLLHWRYIGSAHFPELEQCAPNLDEWNDKRAKPAKPTVKKKK